MHQLQLTRDDEPIIAQCTPTGPGALALMRVTGVQALQVMARISKLAGGGTLTEQPSHSVQFGWIVDEHGKHLDQVLFIIMHAPRTFTGQDTVEITCHNNQFVINTIIETALRHGARLAQQGEFSKRAFLNKKIDLLQAEAINELIHAQTQTALKQSLAQVEGSFSAWITKIEQELLTLLAWSEASFEFLDDEQEFGDAIKTRLAQVITSIETFKKSHNAQQHIRQGIRIALIGSVNAGKSSLFNELVGSQRAIVTNIAGTTRDSIEMGVYRFNNYVTFVDTAGLRITNDVIEQEGIHRSYQEAAKADIILLVIDGSQILSGEEHTVYHHILARYQDKIIPIVTKADLPQQLYLLALDKPIALSCITQVGYKELEAVLETKISQLFNDIASPFMLNQRHYQLLLKLEQALLSIQSITEQSVIQYELLSLQLRDALELLSELTGKSISEAGLDKVFKEFCVGK